MGSGARRLGAGTGTISQHHIGKTCWQPFKKYEAGRPFLVGWVIYYPRLIIPIDYRHVGNKLPTLRITIPESQL